MLLREAPAHRLFVCLRLILAVAPTESKLGLMRPVECLDIYDEMGAYFPDEFCRNENIQYVIQTLSNIQTIVFVEPLRQATQEVLASELREITGNSRFF